MSIRTDVGNTVHSFGDSIDGVLSGATTKFQSIIGSVSTGFTNLWSGGFTGMSHDGLIELQNRLEKYVADLEETISGFAEQEDINIALRGAVEAATVEFVEATKKLLQAYVYRLNQEITEMSSAYNAFMEFSTEQASNVSAAASDAESQAQQIRSEVQAVRID